MFNITRIGDGGVAICCIRSMLSGEMNHPVDRHCCCCECAACVAARDDTMPSTTWSALLCSELSRSRPVTQRPMQERYMAGRTAALASTMWVHSDVLHHHSITQSFRGKLNILQEAYHYHQPSSFRARLGSPATSRRGRVSNEATKPVTSR